MSEIVESLTQKELNANNLEVVKEEIVQCEVHRQEVKKHDFIQITSNWRVANDKKLSDTITTVFHNDFSGSMPLDEVATSTTSLELIPETEHESCTIDIKLTNNQKIARIGVSSEASVLEVFKEYKEYATTIFSEFIDEFEGCTVYLGGVVFDRPTPEASIKFTRVKNDRSSIYLYGIRLVLEESNAPTKPADQFDLAVISDLLKLAIDPEKKLRKPPVFPSGFPISNPLILRDSGVTEYFEKLMGLPPVQTEKNDNDSRESKSNSVNGRISNNNNSPEDFTANFLPIENGIPTFVPENSDSSLISNIENMIDRKLKAMEARLMDKIEQVGSNTNKTLEEILKRLENMKK